MPLVRVLDPGAGPPHFFGAELRRWRTAAGLSQEQLGERVSYSCALVGKVRTGDRAPSLDFAQGCDRALPEAGGLFARLYLFARQWGGGHPSWFSGWLEAERRATSLRWCGSRSSYRGCCEPRIMPAPFSERTAPREWTSFLDRLKKGAG